MEEEHIVIFDTEQLVQARGWSRAEATLAAEVGGTLTDLFQP